MKGFVKGSARDFMKRVGKSVPERFKKFRITRKVFAYPYVLFMLLFVIAPMIMILVAAFQDNRTAEFTFDYFAKVFSSDYKFVWDTLGRSFWVGIVTTVLCIVIGYPVAYILSRKPYYQAGILLMLYILPMWVNMLLRTLATRNFLEVLNKGEPVFGMAAVLFGLVYNFLPFMIMPLHTALIAIDKSYPEAARDLGAGKAQVFLKVTLPMSMSGILSGITMVFVPTISTFAITNMLSGGKIKLFGDLINDYFIGVASSRGVGSVLSLIMLVIVLFSNLLMTKLNREEAKEGGNVW